MGADENRLSARAAAALEAVKPLVSFAAVLAIWWFGCIVTGVRPTIVPSPPDTLEAAIEMANSGVLWSDLAASLSRAAIGFSIGATLGIAIGLLTGRTRLFRMLLNPFLTVMRPIPAIALVPVAIVWFGIGEGSKYFVISYTVFLAVWFNTHQGMDYVPDLYIRASRSLGASRLREFFLVVIPSAGPHILAGIRLGVALAFLSLVAAELTGASSGIGYRLQEARQYIRTDRMFALLIVLGLLGALFDTLVYRIGRRIVHWQQA